MKLLFWIIIALYFLLTISLLTQHLGLSQKIAQTLFGLHLLALIFYLFQLHKGSDTKT